MKSITQPILRAHFSRWAATESDRTAYLRELITFNLAEARRFATQRGRSWRQYLTLHLHAVRAAKQLLALVLIAVLGACADAPVAPGAFPPGTYTLTSVNGQLLPAPLVGLLTLSSGTITVHNASDFSAQTCYNICQLSRLEGGQYSRVANRVTLTTSGWGYHVNALGQRDSVFTQYIRTLTIRGDELVQNGGGDFGGYTLTYTRR